MLHELLFAFAFWEWGFVIQCDFELSGPQVICIDLASQVGDTTGATSPESSQIYLKLLVYPKWSLAIVVMSMIPEH